MSKEEIVDLMLKSSDYNPYTGKLSTKDNYIAAIELAQLCREFAENGETDAAMNNPVEDWNEVIEILKTKQRWVKVNGDILVLLQ